MKSDQEIDGPWWASVYTSDQGAQPGALFGVFNYGGDPSLARFYFKDVAGQVVDDFLVASSLVQAQPSLRIGDVREFWERAEDRNRNTAQLFDKLGLPEYQAIEAFVLRA